MLSGGDKKALVLRCAVAALGIVLSAGGVVQGAIIEIGLAGWVTKVDGADVLEGQINVDDVVTGWYRYDSSTPDTNPLIAIGDYKYNTPSFGISLNIGGLLFASDSLGVDFLIQLSNDLDSKDSYLLNSANNLPVLSGVTVTRIMWQLEDYSGTALSDDALPLTKPVLTDWQDGNYLSITCRGSGAGARIEATMTDAYLVPEPATILMFGAGMLIFCSGDKRRTPNIQR